jgi:hypothetical protein
VWGVGVVAPVASPPLLKDVEFMKGTWFGGGNAKRKM